MFENDLSLHPCAVHRYSQRDSLNEAQLDLKREREREIMLSGMIPQERKASVERLLKLNNGFDVS